MTIQWGKSEVRQDEYFARLDEGQIKEILVAAVKQAVGLSPDDASIEIDRCWISMKTGGLSTREAEAEIKLVKKVAP